MKFNDKKVFKYDNILTIAIISFLVARIIYIPFEILIGFFSIFDTGPRPWYHQLDIYTLLAIESIIIILAIIMWIRYYWSSKKTVSIIIVTLLSEPLVLAGAISLIALLQGQDI